MLVIIKMLTSQEVAGPQRVRDTVSMWEGIQPEDCIGNKTNQHDAGNLLERQRVIATAGPVLNGANILLDFQNMFILGTIVECNCREDRLKGVELWIGKCGGDSKAAPAICIYHPERAAPTVRI